MAEHEPPLTVGELAQLTGLLLGALVFFILIALDIRKAVKKGNFWVPGRALALSALTIQLMNFIEYRSALLDQALLNQSSNCTCVNQPLLDHYRNCTDVVQNSNCTLFARVQFTNITVQFTNITQVQSTLIDQNSKTLMVVKSNVFDKDDKKLKDEVLTDVLFMVHCSRVMLCVLIAFFLPGMARPGYEEKWTTIAALGFTIFLHIFSELLSVRRNLSKSSIHLVSYFFYFSTFGQVNDVWVIAYGAIISVSLIWLLQLLICATIANKGIRNMILQRIPLILPNPGDNPKLQAVEDQVLKSWIVARAFYPEFILASSALASSAALAVTVCLVLSIVGWIIHGPFTMIHAGPGFWLKFIITIVEILFSLIGGAIIGWRWLASVACYGRWGKKEEKWRVEDYWTMHILELQKTEESPMMKKLLKIIGEEGESQKVSRLLLQCRFWLLRCVFWLQWVVVFFSKGYCFLSELVVTKVATKILSKHLKTVEREFDQYRHLLSDMSILSETPLSVYFSNRNSIKQAKEIMEKGHTGGEQCHTLISFLLKHRRPETCVDISCLHPGTANNHRGLKFLWQHNPASGLNMEKYLIYPSKQPWKLTSVSLINIISRLRGDSFSEDYYKVYEEAWELMNLLEESDHETDSLLSKAADREFMTLRKQAVAVIKEAESSPPPTTLEEARAEIERLEGERKKEVMEAKINVDDNKHDTQVDLEKIAAGITLYNICSSMNCSSGDFSELMKELESTLAHIIGTCIEKVGAALVEISKKWAQDMNWSQEMKKTKLLQAVYITGKLKGLSEEMDKQTKLLQAVYIAEKLKGLSE